MNRLTSWWHAKKAEWARHNDQDADCRYFWGDPTDPAAHLPGARCWACRPPSDEEALSLARDEDLPDSASLDRLLVSWATSEPRRAGKKTRRAKEDTFLLGYGGPEHLADLAGISEDQMTKIREEWVSASQKAWADVTAEMKAKLQELNPTGLASTLPEPERSDDDDPMERIRREVQYRLSTVYGTGRALGRNNQPSPPDFITGHAREAMKVIRATLAADNARKTEQVENRVCANCGSLESKHGPGGSRWPCRFTPGTPEKADEPTVCPTPGCPDDCKGSPEKDPMIELERPVFHIGGQTYKIQPTSCRCGGSLAWMRLKKYGGWEMVGCVCHTLPGGEPNAKTEEAKPAGIDQTQVNRLAQVFHENSDGLTQAGVHEKPKIVKGLTAVFETLGVGVTTEREPKPAGDLVVDSGWLCESVNAHTCGAGDNYGHEPGCGLIPMVKLEDLPGMTDHLNKAKRESADRTVSLAISMQRTKRGAPEGFVYVSDLTALRTKLNRGEIK